MNGFDAAFSVESVLPRVALLNPRPDVIHRYYGGSRQKDLSYSEAQAVRAAGFDLVTQFEAGGNHLSWFTAEQGATDAKIALQQAADCDQPAGSSIYFCYDLDLTAAQIISHAVPYHRAILSAFRAASVQYDPDAYGSGLLGHTLRQAGLIKRLWLAQAHGWAGYQRYKSEAVMLQGRETSYGIGGAVDIDTEIGDYGGWAAARPLPAPVPVTPPAPATKPTRDEVVATIKTLQTELYALGDYGSVSGDPIDGDPGPMTLDALMRFRRGS